MEALRATVRAITKLSEENKKTIAYLRQTLLEHMEEISRLHVQARELKREILERRDPVLLRSIVPAPELNPPEDCL